MRKQNFKLSGINRKNWGIVRLVIFTEEEVEDLNYQLEKMTG